MRRLLNFKQLIIALLCCSVFITNAMAESESVRLKDLGKFAGWRENALVGYGLVTGLAGTGDSSSNKATRQSIANMLAQFDVAVSPDDIVSRNTAAVMVTAVLPPYTTTGDTLDVTVTSMGDARSLSGGSLLITPLKAPNNKVYALAQGPVSLGGYKFAQNGTLAQKNHPTVGSIPNGASVEVAVKANVLSPEGKLTFTLADADYTTAARVAFAVNNAFGASIADPRDAESIEIRVPDNLHLVAFMARIESLNVEPDVRARVVVNERTGTIVAGGDVRISKVVISHGDLKISIVTDNTVSQPIYVRQTGRGVRTQSISNSRIDVDEREESGYVSASNNTVADLIQALTQIKTNTRDIISILRAIKAAGALHADLVVQ
ncbi:Flagellar basal-body P-ring protein [Solimicrobium silvestre]|uniref:Flagellar P-ring protein n=2 Tax=Solimicrobium silvestre TaxID=2099400 RepID=A0A2S9H214_9BURK|nr:Flagellar basal-body P-ring protein [Solimicrobium silvestre]